MSLSDLASLSKVMELPDGPVECISFIFKTRLAVFLSGIASTLHFPKLQQCEDVELPLLFEDRQSKFLSFSVLIASPISARLGLIVVIFPLVAVLLSSKRDSLICAELLIASKCFFHVRS